MDESDESNPIDSAPDEDPQGEPLIDEGWAVVVATDDDEQAQAIHDRLRMGGLDAFIRDVEPEPGDERLPIQVIVPAEDAAAAVLELELALSVRDGQADPGRVDRVGELGFVVDDLEIAELSATGGPVYELDEIGDDEEIRALLVVLEVERIRFTLDRSANLVVHHNDEIKVDDIMDRLFGPEQHRGGSDSDDTDATDDEEPEVASEVVIEVGEVSAPAAVATRGVGDIEGRPVVDDLTPDHVITTSSGAPMWLYAAVAVICVVVFIVLVV